MVDQLATVPCVLKKVAMYDTKKVPQNEARIIKECLHSVWNYSSYCVKKIAIYDTQKVPQNKAKIIKECLHSVRNFYTYWKSFDFFF